MPAVQNPPEVLVEVSAPYPAWSEPAGSPPAIVVTAVKEVFLCAPLPGYLEGSKSVEVSILLANDDLVRTLNREYRGKDKSTNVLSFPQTSPETPGEVRRAPAGEAGAENPVVLGDVILAHETVLREAESKLIPLEDHIAHLVVHGTLHLIGYDHEEEDAACQMEEMEIWIMRRLGFKNPYTW